jgi:hypothetical protein
MLQAACSDGLPFDPFSFCQDGWTASAVDIGWSEIVDALVVAAVVVVGDEGRDLGLEIAGQVIVLQQDAGS